MTMLEPGCACGDVRRRMRSAPMFVHCCHCHECQRQTGGAFVVNALIEADRVEGLAGETDPVLVPGESGTASIVHRRPDRKVAHYGGRTGLSFVRVGRLDAPAALPPDARIDTRSKLPWVALPQGAPAFETYSDSKTLLPADSPERRRAIFG